MFSFLLAIIYASFISLGLPDSMLGSGWPAMHQSLGVPLSYVGVISMIISAGTVVSSLFAVKVVKKIGVARVTALSIAINAAALLGFSLTNSFYIICLLAIPYGLGAGAVDAALNNYVAVNYSSKQMNWLHCAWGVGVSISPYIMSFSLAINKGWGFSYFIVFIMQAVLSVIVFASVPLWKKQNSLSNTENISENTKITSVFKIKGAKTVLIAFFCYCCIETTFGLWIASYLIEVKGIDIKTATAFTSLYYTGITVGRFLSGIIADKVGDKNMVRYGCVGIIIGLLIVIIPVKITAISFVALLIVGLGCAPIYPCTIHSTPKIFGEKNSQALIGLQMAFAYIGCTFAPPAFGLVVQHLNINLLPFYISIFSIAMIISTELLNKKTKYNN